MELQLITPEKILFAGTITQVDIPGTLGDFGVLPGHAAFVSTLREGIVNIFLENGENYKINVTGGIAEVTPEQCVVLADNAAILPA